MMEELIRLCPLCYKIIIYKKEIGFLKAEKNRCNCRSCASFVRMSSKEARKRISKNLMGEKNPFFGKKHSKEATEKIKPTQFKKGHISTHEHNPLKVWKEKYDEETYNQKVNDLKEKQRKKSLGSNNPMYGKPSPQGSGNGWSGWYKGWFFRSIGELSYMVNVIDRFDLKWVTGESHEYKIKYTDWEGVERNYFPDFIIADKYMVESKPKRLWSSPKVMGKTEAAIEFCKNNGMVYKLVDCRKLTEKEIMELYLGKSIIFTERYEKKFKNEYYNR